MALLTSLPRADGFRMPGEFEPHAGCWMLWPVRPDVWREDAQPAKAAFAAVAAAISRFEPVTMGVDPDHLAAACAILPDRVRVTPLAYDDAWVRDTGPTFVRDGYGQVRGVDWGFNAWGGLYAPWDRDEEVAAQICDLAGLDRYRTPLILEGGSIHVDGQGTLLTTEECLLNPNRNPDLDRAQIEGLLRDNLGVETIIWLPRGLADDETAGHVDNLACFARPGEVILSWSDDPADPQYDICREAEAALAAAVDARGRRLVVHHLDHPAPLAMTAAEAAGLAGGTQAIQRTAGRPLSASYVNFYLTNGAVVMPCFGDSRGDSRARNQLQAIFPNREVLGVTSREILLGGGNIHCITQQQPAAG